jgi:hypothetical protein
MRRIALLVFLVAAELAGCYAGVRGCGCDGHRGYREGPRGGFGCGCG